MSHNCYLCLEKVNSSNQKIYCKCKGSMIPHISCMENYIQKTDLRICPNCRSNILKESNICNYYYYKILNMVIFILLLILSIMYYILLFKMIEIFLKSNFGIQCFYLIVMSIFFIFFAVVIHTLYKMIFYETELMILERETNQ